MQVEDPEAWARAVTIDNALREPGRIVNRKMDSTMYLHRLCKPLEEIDFKELAKKREMPQFVQECEGMCGV